MVAVNGLQQQTWGSPYNDGSDQWLQSLVEAEGASSVGDESGGGDHSQWQQAGSQSSKRFTPTGEFGTMVTAAPAAAPIAPPRPGAATFAKAKAAVTKASANAATEEPIHAAWQRFSSASPYRLMQQMAEHKWSAKDVAQATGQTEQAVGDYLTIHGAPKGFGGEVTIGQEAIAEPYMRALDAAYSAMPQERVIATRNLSGPWSDEDGSPPQYGPVPFWNVQQVSRYVDGSSWTEETVSFDLAAFNQWYFSQGTPESVALARMPGLLGSLTAPAWDRHEQGEGGHVYWSWRASHLSWGTDPQRDAIRAYLSYPAESEETVQELSLVAFDPLMTGELLHAFGTDQLALPETAQGERMRARFGSELATQLYRIDRSQEALRASYAAALDLAMGTRPPDGDLLPAGVTQRYEAYPGWSVTLVKGADGGADRNVSEFDLVAFHEWYVKQDDPKAKLFVQFYGDQLEVQETRLQNQEDASYTIQRTYLTGQGNGFRVDAGYTVRDENSETHIGSSISPQGYVLVDLARPPRLFNDEVVYFDPVMGFMTVPENIKPKDTGLFEQLVTTGMLVAVSLATGGVAAAAGWAGLTTAAVTGAMGSIAGTFLTGGELTLRGIFKGALTSVLTAGLMDGLKYLAGLEGLKDLLPANVFERGSLSLVAGRTAVQGIVSTVMGDSFKDGLRAGLVSGVAEALSAELNDNIDLMEMTAELTGSEVQASRLAATMLARALRVVASGEQNPAYAYARGLLGDLMEGLDKVKPAAPETSPASTAVESTEVAPEAATPVAVPAAGVAPATADSSSGSASQASGNTSIGEGTSGQTIGSYKPSAPLTPVELNVSNSQSPETTQSGEGTSGQTIGDNEKPANQPTASGTTEPVPATPNPADVWAANLRARLAAASSPSVIAQAGDSWARLAKEQYGDERYALALARYNGATDSTLPVGSTVLLPTFTNVNLREGGNFISDFTAAQAERRSERSRPPQQGTSANFVPQVPPFSIVPSNLLVPDLLSVVPQDFGRPLADIAADPLEFQRRNPQTAPTFVLPINTMAIDAPDYTLRTVYGVPRALLQGALEGGAIVADLGQGLYTIARNELGLGLDIRPPLSGSLQSLEAGMPIDEYYLRVNPVGNVMASLTDVEIAESRGDPAALADARANLAAGAFGLYLMARPVGTFGANRLQQLGFSDYNLVFRSGERLSLGTNEWTVARDGEGMGPTQRMVMDSDGVYVPASEIPALRGPVESTAGTPQASVPATTAGTPPSTAVTVPVRLTPAVPVGVDGTPLTLGGPGTPTVTSPSLAGPVVAAAGSGTGVPSPTPAPATLGDLTPSEVGNTVPRQLELFTGERGVQVSGAAGVGPTDPAAIAADARSMPNIPSGSQSRVVASNPFIPPSAGGTGQMMDYLPEAARVTEPGGQIVINGNSANKYFTTIPSSEQLAQLGLEIGYQGELLPEFRGMTFVRTDGSPIDPTTLRSIVFNKKP